jgi:hypothetical protein
VASLPLTNITKSAITTSIARILQLPPDAVMFIRYEILGSQNRLLTGVSSFRPTETRFDISVFTRTSLLMSVFPQYASNVTLYLALSHALSAAVNTGNFTAMLQKLSLLEFPSNQTVSADVTDIVSQQLDTVVPPTFSPTPRPSRAEDITGAITGGALAGLVLLTGLIAFAVYRHRQHKMRRTVYLESDDKPAAAVVTQRPSGALGRDVKIKKAATVRAAPAKSQPFHDISRLSAEYRVMDRISVKPIARRGARSNSRQAEPTASGADVSPTGFRRATQPSKSPNKSVFDEEEKDEEEKEKEEEEEHKESSAAYRHHQNRNPRQHHEEHQQEVEMEEVDYLRDIEAH